MAAKQRKPINPLAAARKPRRAASGFKAAFLAPGLASSLEYEMAP
jgi:hypothetical protein